MVLESFDFFWKEAREDEEDAFDTHHTRVNTYEAAAIAMAQGLQANSRFLDVQVKRYVQEEANINLS